jgi:hypothetical protein
LILATAHLPEARGDASTEQLGSSGRAVRTAARGRGADEAAGIEAPHLASEQIDEFTIRFFIVCISDSYLANP